MRKYPDKRCILKDTCNTENCPKKSILLHLMDSWKNIIPSRLVKVKFLCGMLIRSNWLRVMPGTNVTESLLCHSYTKDFVV